MFAYHARWHRIWFCIFGLHFYTWTLITSILIIIAVAVILAISSMNVAFRSLNINPTCSVLSVGYFCYWLLPTLFQLYWNVAEGNVLLTRSHISYCRNRILPFWKQASWRGQFSGYDALLKWLIGKYIKHLSCRNWNGYGLTRKLQ